MQGKLRTTVILCLACLIGGLALGYFSAISAGKVGKRNGGFEEISSKYTNVDRAKLVKAVLGDKAESTRVTAALLQSCSALGADSKYLLECVDENFRWAEIDAENGGSIGISMIYEQYSHGESCYSLYRALYWLNRLKSVSTADLSDRYADLNSRIKSCQS